MSTVAYKIVGILSTIFGLSILCCSALFLHQSIRYYRRSYDRYGRLGLLDYYNNNNNQYLDYYDYGLSGYASNFRSKSYEVNFYKIFTLAGVGIALGLVQMFFSGTACCIGHKTRRMLGVVYILTHILIGIGSLVCFALALTYKIYYKIVLDESPSFFQNYPLRRYIRNIEGQFYCALFALNVFFCVASSIIVMIVLKSSHQKARNSKVSVSRFDDPGKIVTKDETMNVTLSKN